MTENELIGNLLNFPDSKLFLKESRVSTLTIALRGSRKLSGRCLETGKLLDDNEKLDKLIDELEEGRFYSALFIGLTNYLVLLDLFGMLFTKNRGSKKIPKDGIMSALDNFVELESKEKKAIKGLRNSLAHNFGLANQTYSFSLSFEYENMLEILKMDEIDKGKDMSKIKVNINEVKLCTFIEGIYFEIQKLHSKDEIFLTMDEEEVKSRFTIK